MRKALGLIMTLSMLLALASLALAYPRTVLVENFTNWA